MHGRAIMESRFGPLGCGQQWLELGGTRHDLHSLATQLGIEFDDLQPIDVQPIDNHFVLRYVDVQDARIVAQEFDASFRRLAEIRAHVAEWLGEQAYFSSYAGH